LPRSRGGSDGQENQNPEKQRQEKQSIEKNSAWAVGGRIGYLVTPAILTTSMATTLRRGSAVSPSLVTGSYSFPSQTYTGAIIGGRTEIAMQNWWPGLFWRSGAVITGERRCAAECGELCEAAGHPSGTK